MPTFPSPPLKFRTARFPRYGFKAGLSDEAVPAYGFAIVLRALCCHRLPYHSKRAKFTKNSACPADHSFHTTSHEVALGVTRRISPWRWTSAPVILANRLTLPRVAGMQISAGGGPLPR
jgi:hypothetical protein